MLKEIWFLLCRWIFSRIPLRLFVNSLRLIQAMRKRGVYYMAHSDTPLSFNDFLLKEKSCDKYFGYSHLADKFLVRNYVQERIGANYLIPLRGVFMDAIDLLRLDAKDGLIVKANHGSGWNLVCRNSMEVEESLDTFKNWMSKNAYYLSREKQYLNIAPRLVVEELISDNPVDFKIFCVSGIPKVIQVDTNRFTDHRRDFYSVEWEKLDFQFIYPMSDITQDAPEGLDEMLLVAKKLSHHIDFVRVDLYWEKNRVFFGELTFCPEGGMGFFRDYNEDIEFAKYLGL